MVKKKQDWRSPITSYQEFVPQDFIAACTRELLGYKAYGSMIHTGNLYHDNNHNGYYNRGEDLDVQSGSVPANASQNPNSNYVHTSVLPVNINDNYYYTRFSYNIFNDFLSYTSKLSGPLYVYNNHYFTSYEKITTAS